MPKKSLAAPDPSRVAATLCSFLLALAVAGASALLLAPGLGAQEPAGLPPVVADSAAAPDPGPAESIPATAPAAATRLVGRIRVSGVATVDTLRVLDGFRVRPGDAYSASAIREGVKSLYRLDLFTQVEVTGAEAADGRIDLTVAVTEAPRIGSVEITGNREIGSDKVREKLTGMTGRTATDRTRQEVVTTLTELYRSEGFPLAEIAARFDPGTKPNERQLVVDVREGARVQITAITFDGNTRFSDEDLRDKIDTKQKSFWRKGHLKEAVLDEDLDKLRAHYQRNGYRDVRIGAYDIRYSEDRRTAEVAINVVEGPLYTMAPPVIEGNTVLPASVLASFISFKPGDRYNRQKIDESAGEIGGAYADRGYLYCQVDPEERIDSTVVHVTYRVEEQEVSRIREIRITGNTRTKERVIRRQLYIFPGQRFDRALLIRSQRELFQLGFFENVEVDFRPIPNSYDVDLVLNMTEKAVGTASAGAGFSSQGGLTGFLELGHPNLFGNGQAVNLRLERGSRTSTYEMSFTEPWFMGSPTTLGIDLFRTNLIRDLYELNRTGGSLRFGRPVPGVPYTRMFGNYTFERTDGLGRFGIDERISTVYTDDDSLSFTESSVLSRPDPIAIDPATRSSSGFTLGLSRNSTDHPVYPSTGSSATGTWEMTGGFLQGNVRYQKGLIDTRFFSSKLPVVKFGKPAWMIRTQLGAVGFLGREDPLRGDYPPTDSLDVDPVDPEDRYYRVEAFELFRLGGTTRGQSLRGYDDYEVVPESNVRRREVIRRTKIVEDDVITSDISDTSVAYDTFPGGRYYGVLSLERQFTLVDPLHAVLFAEAGGTWNEIRDFRWSSIHKSLGFGVRMEIPLLGLVGFDYAYGFDRLNRSRDPSQGGKYNRGGWQGHLLFGRFF
jgi:outer membrane protein insertion porin family